MTGADLQKLAGTNATIEGTARDAHQGAVVLLEDRTPVYVAGLDEWPDDANGEDVRATGTVRRASLTPDPTTDAQGAVSHGAEGDDWVLEDATWEVV